jgi:uncharacterized RDD family membrane protein YckC
MGAEPSVTSEVKSAGPLRRLGAILYDTLLVVALLMVFTALFLLFTREPVTPQSGWRLYLYRAVLVSVVLTFFVYFWTVKGRTLGMQAWRLRVERMDGSLPTVRDVLLRLMFAAVPWIPGVVVAVLASQSAAPKNLATIGYCLFALVSLNYASAWFDVQRRSWHDRFLQTRVRKL